MTRINYPRPENTMDELEKRGTDFSRSDKTTAGETLVDLGVNE